MLNIILILLGQFCPLPTFYSRNWYSDSYFWHFKATFDVFKSTFSWFSDHLAIKLGTNDHFLKITIFYHQGTVDSPPKFIFYWFIFHFLHQERDRWISSTTTQPPDTDKYQLFFVMKRESELDSFKWLWPQALFLYLCWFTRYWQSFWFLITCISFLK